AVRQLVVVLPQSTATLAIPWRVSTTPHWLEAPNPLLNHPWRDRPDATLAAAADTVVIGAGFTGAAVAYHWARRAPAQRDLVVLEMGDAADGASGRNQGTVVMGRYFTMVRDTVHRDLP